MSSAVASGAALGLVSGCAAFLAFLPPVGFCGRFAGGLDFEVMG